MAENPPAWHPDPTGTHDHRWWDGQRWTEHVADAGVAAIDPLPAAPPADGGAGAGTSAAGGDTGSGTTEPGASASAPGAMGAAGAVGADAGGSGAPDATSSPAAGDTGGPPAWESRPAEAGWGQQPAAGVGGSQPAWPGTETGGVPAWGAQQPAGDPGGTWGAGGPPAGGAPAWGAEAPSGDPTKTPGIAIAALVLGLLAIPSAIIIIGGLLGLVAIIMGAVASGKAKRGEAGGRGIAIGGIVTGAIGLLIAIGLFVTIFAGIAGEAARCIEETGDPDQCQDLLERDLMERFG